MPPACRNLWQPRSLVRPVPLNRVFLQSPDIGRIYTRPTLPNESRDVPLDTLHLPRGKHAVCGQSVAGNSAPATAHGEAIPELPGRLVQAPPPPRHSCVPAARADGRQHSSDAWSPRRNTLVQVRGCTSHLNTNFVTGKHSCFE